MLVGEGFGPLIQIYPHLVQAGLIRTKPETIHYVYSDGAQADTPPLQCEGSSQKKITAFSSNFKPNIYQRSCS